VIGELCYAIPCQAAPLTAPPKRTPPQIGQVEPERAERAAVRRDSKVAEVAGHDLPQLLPLFGDWPVHSAPQLLLDLPELRSHAVAVGLSL
jgi:hypothetical protein